MVVQAHSPTGVEADGSCHVVCAHVSLLCSVDGLLWTLTAPHRVLVRGEAGVRPQRDRRGRRCTDGAHGASSVPAVLSGNPLRGGPSSVLLSCFRSVLVRGLGVSVLGVSPPGVSLLVLSG